jgi:glycerol-3-phosphate acyltransferase PlsX
MGTDAAPGPEVAGTLTALADLSDIEVVLVGDAEAVERELAKYPSVPRDRLTVVHAQQRVLAGEPPAASVRRKPESSIMVGLKLQRDGEAQAFVSAGSTGAVMAASLLILRPLPGVHRPAIGILLPTAQDPVLMLDAGANVDCKPHHLVQFAHLGHVYAQDLMGLPTPRIGLLNIGEEEGKGNEATAEAHTLLLESGLNFVGNIEGREIIAGGLDVLVCDGFVGNTLLKFYESVAEFVVALLKREIRLSHTTELVDFHEVFQVLDYAEYGGAPLLGLNGVSIICHGESPPKAIHKALGVAARAVSSKMVSHIGREPSIASASGAS